MKVMRRPAILERVRHLGVSYATFAMVTACLALVGASALAASLDRQVTFSIPAQPLESALMEFSRQADVQLAIDATSLDRIQAPELNGTLLASTALSKLLNQTGLSYRIVGSTVTVGQAPKTARADISSASANEALSSHPEDQPESHKSLFSRLFHLSQANETAGNDNKQISQSGSGSESVKIEEIIVTAQKRSENLQQVPISAQVVSGQTLAEQNHNALEELGETVPGVNITSRSGSNLITIRGIGSGESSSFDQSVGMFTDDIYHGRSRMSLGTFLDLDHIEVLKGPQSTFFGNNAIAGAFNIVTRKPGDSFDAWARMLYGQFDQYVAEGAIGGPIADTFGARLAVTTNGDTRGWLYNENTDQHVPIIHNSAERLTLDFHPGDLDVTLKIEGSEHRTTGSTNELPEQLTNCPPPAPLDINFPAFGSCAYALANGLPTGLNQNTISQLGGQGNSLSTFEDVLTVNYHRWNQTFTSVTGFYNYHFFSTSDATERPVDTQVSFALPEKYHQFSQEFRVTSPTGQPVEYTAGAYLQTDSLYVSQQLNVPLFDAFGVVPPQYLPVAEDTPFSQSEHIYSLFGSLKWNITDRLHATAGLRASHVKKEAITAKEIGVSTGVYCCYAAVPPDIQADWAPFLGTSGETSLSRNDNALMPSAGIQYQIDPAAMLYFRFDRGFKAGGFNGNTLGTAASLTFDPEHVNAFELGIKSKWFDDTVLMNLDVFRMNYQGLQVPAVLVSYAGGQPIYSEQTRNAAAAVSQGVELETRWRMTKGLQLGANVTYLHSYYSSYPNAPQTILQQYCVSHAGIPQCEAIPNLNVFDATGQPTAYAPRWSASMKADYSVALFRDYKFTTEISPFFSSSYNPDPDFSEFKNNAYVRLDARLSLETPDGRWALDVIGKNLTNRTIIVFPTSFYQSKEQPRNIAVQFRYNYGRQ